MKISYFLTIFNTFSHFFTKINRFSTALKIQELLEKRSYCCGTGINSENMICCLGEKSKIPYTACSSCVYSKQASLKSHAVHIHAQANQAIFQQFPSWFEHNLLLCQNKWTFLQNNGWHVWSTFLCFVFLEAQLGSNYTTCS